MSDDNKIALYMVEGFTTTIYRESLEIDISEYPELVKLEEEGGDIYEYIEENMWDMKAPKGSFNSSLAEALQEQEPMREKITGEYSEVFFND